MPYVITSQCQRVGACADVCPTDSIHWVDDDPEWPFYYINPDTCIECGACAAVCPQQAIYADDEVPDELKDAIARNAEYYTDGPGTEQV